MAHKILVINPGSTSTKVAIFENSRETDTCSLIHTQEEIDECETITDQLAFRKEAVCGYLKERGMPLKSFSAIAARGGVIGQLESGAYLINDVLAEASRQSPCPHASNLAAVIANELSKEADIPAYIYDAVCSCGIPDEIFTISGLPEIQKPFLTHVLNSRAVAIDQARKDQHDLRKTAYIVAHLGGGVTVNLISGGAVRDFVGDDEGAFSPERAGGVPCRALTTLCYSNTYSEKQMQKRLKGQGGMRAYLQTSSLAEAEKMIDEGNQKAASVVDAMAMQIAKDIGAMATVEAGKLTGIILTGGMAYSQEFTERITKRVSFLAPVFVVPGTMEMRALACGVCRVLDGEETAYLFETAEGL